VPAADVADGEAIVSLAPRPRPAHKARARTVAGRNFTRTPKDGPPGVAMSSDWEVFASILVRDLGKKLAAGIDLSEYEVKSALDGGNYEYHYHKNTGKAKLKRDMEVGHLFYDHRENLRHVDLRYAHGSSMRQFFAEWLADYPDPYPQRYRKNIPFQWVKKNGVLLMTLTDGEVTYPHTARSKTQL
jgi:hypothetical protein